MSAESILWGKLTPLSLGALAMALTLGIFGHAADGSWIEVFSRALAPIGSVWVSALRMTVVPLVLAQLLSALLSGEGDSIGSLGGRTLGLIVLFLVSAGASTVAAVGPVARLFPVDPVVVRDVLSGTSLPAAALDVAASAPVSLGDWLVGLVPENLFAGLATGDILPILLFSVLFGAAASGLPVDRRDALGGIFRSIAQAMMQLVFWVLWFTPVGVFALVLGMTLQSGSDLLGFLGFYVILVTGWLLVVTGALYPITALLGRTTIRVFSRAVAPAQMVAVSTRSSLAALPALIEGGQEHLRLEPTATGFVLPFLSAVFKMSTMTAEPVRFVLLTHLFGVPLSAPLIGTFLVTLVLLSFSGVGVPQGGSGFDTLPAYAAAGIPLEGLVLVVAVDTIPDIGKTLVNVTGQMSLATLVTRGSRGAPPMERAPRASRLDQKKRKV